MSYQENRGGMVDAAPLSLISLAFALFAAPRAACGEGGLSLSCNIMAVSNDDICHSKARSKSALKMPPASLTEAAVALLCPLITKCVFLRVIFSTVVLFSAGKGARNEGRGRNLRPDIRANILALRRNPHSCRTVLKTRHLRRNSIWCSSERATSEKAGGRANGACNRPLSPRRIYNTSSKYTRASFLPLSWCHFGWYTVVLQDVS